MKAITRRLLDALFVDHPLLKSGAESIEGAFDILHTCYAAQKKVLICGNGGSAADSEHIVGELMKGFNSQRPLSPSERKKLTDCYAREGPELADRLQGALPAISLVSQVSLCTALANDVSADMVFAQQVFGYGCPGDVLIGISTSGNAAGVLNAVRVANAFDLPTIGLTGQQGGRLKSLCTVTIGAPHDATPFIQEFHQVIYHTLCAMLETEFF